MWITIFKNEINQQTRTLSLLLRHGQKYASQGSWIYIDKDNEWQNV